MIFICLVNSDAALAEQKKVSWLTADFSKMTSSTGLGNDPQNYAISQKRKRPESAYYIRLQLEYLHLLFVSIATGSVNEQLLQRPTLDVKTSIIEHEHTLDVVCDLANKSPAVFLQAY